MRKPENKFHRPYDADDIIVAIPPLGESPATIIPKNVKYRNVKYMKNKYQKNLAAFHSNPIIVYTKTP